MLNNILFFIMKTKLIIYFFLFSFINSKLWNLDSMFQYAKNNLTLGFEDYGIFNPDNLLTYEDSLSYQANSLYIFLPSTSKDIVNFGSKIEPCVYYCGHQSQRFSAR